MDNYIAHGKGKEPIESGSNHPEWPLSKNGTVAPKPTEDDLEDLYNLDYGDNFKYFHFSGSSDVGTLQA